MANRLTIDDLGGSCIIDTVRGKRSDDYDGYNDYNPFVVERYE
jgi:hypothetical protein